MARVLRAPLLHFLVIGALLLGLRTWREPAAAPRARIVIGAADRARLPAGWLGPDDRPSEADLETYLARHAEELAEPPRTRLAHVYLSEQARGAAAASDALALLGELRGAGPEAAVGRGDAFIRGAEVDGTPADLERIFGPGFAATVGAAPLRTWVGPVRSTYGLHLVWVHAREPGRTPALAEVRGRVVQRWLRERSEQREREAMEEMRARYVVQVEGAR